MRATLREVALFCRCICELAVLIAMRAIVLLG
jgi:hypothetical protein